MTRNIKQILLFGLVLRLVLAPFFSHPDVIDNLNWGKNLLEEGLTGFYRRDIPDAGPPNYPPLYYYINLGQQSLYEVTKGLIWQLNVILPFFPSKFYLWFESQKGNIFFNKLPAMFADLGIGYVLYKFVRLFKNAWTAENTTALFLFLPGAWYVSAVWGQTDSLYLLPLVGSVYLLVKKRWYLGVILYLLSLLIKPTGIFLLPIFAYIFLKHFNMKTFTFTLLTSIFILILFALPFLEQISVRDVVDLYKNNIREVTGYLTANSFNLWSLLYGFVPISDSLKIFGVKAYQLGEAVYLLIAVYVISKLKEKNARSIIYAFAIIAMGTFVFLTKMHERYYFLTFVFFTLLYGIEKKMKTLYILVSIIFFLNLYHFWWMPKIPILVDFLSFNLMEKMLALANVFIFFVLLSNFAKLSEKG